jgi:hypothetical protein
MQQFKFFKNNELVLYNGHLRNDPYRRGTHRRRYLYIDGEEIDITQRLHWLMRNCVTLTYLDPHTNLETGEIDYVMIDQFVVSFRQRFDSYHHLIAQYFDSFIFPYSFMIEDANYTYHYSQENFHEMPKDVPIIFYGVRRYSDPNIIIRNSDASI